MSAEWCASYKSRCKHKLHGRNCQPACRDTQTSAALETASESSGRKRPATPYSAESSDDVKPTAMVVEAAGGIVSEHASTAHSNGDVILAGSVPCVSAQAESVRGAEQHKRRLDRRQAGLAVRRAKNRSERAARPDLHTRGRSQSRQNFKQSRSKSGPHSRRTCLCEVFAGVGNLSRATHRRGVETIPLSNFDPSYSVQSRFDLLRLADFKTLQRLLKRRAVRWIHFAPPCKTYSNARRTDRHGSVKVLRTHKQPLGIDPPGKRPWSVMEANLLTSRTMKLARLQLRAGGFFSIENPLESIMWSVPDMVRLAKVHGVQAFDGEQCIGGGPYRKPTRWLSNAPWMVVLRRVCPGEPEHAPHMPLVGKTTLPDGTWCWRRNGQQNIQKDCATLSLTHISRTLLFRRIQGGQSSLNMEFKIHCRSLPRDRERKPRMMTLSEACEIRTCQFLAFQVGQTSAMRLQLF